MNRYTKDMSTYAALLLIAASAFTASPTIASGVYHLLFVVPLAFIVKLFGQVEGFRQARDEYAPNQPIKNHPLFSFVSFLEEPHFGVRGIWLVMGLAVMLMLYKEFR